jgi:hypothetical protein
VNQESAEMSQSIKDFLSHYESAWSENSAAKIEAAWDAGNNPFYKAEEIEHIMTSWDDVRAYWRHNEAFNSINELSFRDVQSHALSTEIQLVGMRMRWDIRFAQDAKEIDGSAFAWAGKAMGGDNHVMAILKNTDSGLKLNAWVEAPDAPILYMAQLYMQNVRPDFRGR